jgi:uncharacterized membrane protein
VLVMVQTHSLVLLRPELRAGSFFVTLQWIDGLVAPSFIFAAGFSLALTQVRAVLASNEPDARRKRLRRTLRRLGEVLLIATLTNWAWFPIFREPKWLIRIDILHCIGLSLLIALPVLALLAAHPRALRWSALLLAAIAFGSAPFFENVPPPWGNFVSAKTGSIFPLLPWGGYVYLGAAVGAACAADGIRATVKWLLGLAAVGLALWIATPFVSALYPPHDFWVTDPTNHARRWTQVCLIALALLAVEQRFAGAWRTSLPVRFVEVFGTSSLAGYFIHEMLLYYRIGGFSFERVWGNACDWPQYWLVLALLIACTFALTWLTDRIYRRADAALSSGSGVATARTAP